MEEKHQHVSLKLPFHQTGTNALEIISNTESRVPHKRENRVYNTALQIVKSSTRKSLVRE